MAEPQEYGLPPWIIAVDVILTLLAVCAAVIDGFLVYTVFYYKKLRTVPNLLVVNWVIADIFVLIDLSTTYRIIEYLENSGLSRVIKAIIQEVEWVSHTASLFFVTLAAIDWYLASYFEEASKRFRKLYQWLIGGVWLIAILSISIFTILNLNDIYHLPSLIFFFAYLGSFLCVLVFNIIKIVKKYKRRFSDHPTFVLTIATIVVASWIPIWTTVILSDLVIKYAWWLVALCYLSTSVITFTGMYRSNQDFQACVSQTCKCSRNKYSDDLVNNAEYHERDDDDDALAIIHTNAISAFTSALV